MASATYVPGPESFGPGVGIPPLDVHTRPAYDSYQMDGSMNQPYEQVNVNGSPYRKDGAIPHTPGRNAPAPFVLHDDVHELNSPIGPTTATHHNPHFQPPGRVVETSEQYPYYSNTSISGMSSSEAAAVWPLERVLSWLAQNGFSNDWQETFKSLELQGADFLELGHRSNGRPNYGKLHRVVYPQLAKECEKSGTGWDQARERQEGNRLRRSIRLIHEGGYDSGIPVMRRPEHHHLPQSASVPSDPGSEISPAPFHEPASAAPGMATVESSPGHNPNLQASHVGYPKASGGQMRSVTLPVPTSREPMSSDPSQPEPAPGTRLGQSRVVSDNYHHHQKQSPSTSNNDGGALAASLRQYEESPQSGSPATQHALLAYSGPASISTGDLGSINEHSRANSTDSNMGMSRNAPVTSRFYESRKHGNLVRPSPGEPSPRPSGNENPAFSNSKEPSKGFFGNFFKRKPPKASDSSYTSPEEHGLDSPTSPIYTRQPNSSFLPYTRSDYNASDVSLGDRLSTAHASDNASTRTKSNQRGKKWMFVTSDLLNYRLVDVTDIDTVDTLRNVICSKLGMFDWTSSQIYTTEPGQLEHEEPLNDTMLWVFHGRKADATASLKLFVRGSHSYPGPSNASHVFAPGLGIPLSEKALASPSSGQHVHRKPLDDEAISRITHHTHNIQPSSPLSSRQPMSGSPAVHTFPRDAPQHVPAGPLGEGAMDANHLLGPEKADLLARHEEHQREVERKQRAYRAKHPPASQPKKDANGEIGYRREGVIDFDSPRVSPYEGTEKKIETLVPRRKPPTAPPESSTLTKVNSLSKRNVDRRLPSPDQNHGFGAAIASMGKMTTFIGKPSPSGPSPQAEQGLFTSEFAQQQPGPGLVNPIQEVPGKLQFSSGVSLLFRLSCLRV